MCLLGSRVHKTKMIGITVAITDDTKLPYWFMFY